MDNLYEQAKYEYNSISDKEKQEITEGYKEFQSKYSPKILQSLSGEELLDKLTDFTEADADPDPICLLGKEWDEIKLDLADAAEGYARSGK